jgi:hypothetical protein
VVEYNTARSPSIFCSLHLNGCHLSSFRIPAASESGEHSDHLRPIETANTPCPNTARTSHSPTMDLRSQIIREPLRLNFCLCQVQLQQLGSKIEKVKTIIAHRGDFEPYDSHQADSLHFQLESGSTSFSGDRRSRPCPEHRHLRMDIQ